MKNLDCNVIQDLLPSYIDKISSEETNKLIEKHLSTCKDCSLTLKNMNKYVEKKKDILLNKQNEELDYLKKYRKNKIMTVIFAIVLTLCIILCLYLISRFLREQIEFSVDFNNMNLDGVGFYDASNYPCAYFNPDGNFQVQWHTETYFDEEGSEVWLLKFYRKYINRSSGNTLSINPNIASKVYIQDSKGSVIELWNRESGFVSKKLK